ncbi:hypothetical protein FRC12_010537 [Ceratobasidium sp. 428]|nr:hypothetical protein FRC12_010537 [Ceratobasidium sp. 428]
MLDQRRRDGGLMDTKAQPLPVNPGGIRSIMAFLRVSRVVARSSSAARAALVGGQQYQVVRVMLGLVRAYVALEHKGRPFDTLAAFCKTRTAGAEENGGTMVEVIKAVWIHLEWYEVLPVTADTGSGWRKSRGVPAELERYRGACATISCDNGVHLFAQQPCPFTATIPDNLGSERHVPGTGPYVRLFDGSRSILKRPAASTDSSQNCRLFVIQHHDECAFPTLAHLHLGSTSPALDRRC